MYLKTGCTSLSFTTYLSLTCAHVTSLRAKAWISKWTEVSSRANFTATKQQHSPQFLDFNGFQRYCITHTHTPRFVLKPWMVNEFLLDNSANASSSKVNQPQNSEASAF